MLPKNPIPPGEMLLEEFLEPAGLSQAALARHIGVPVQRVNQIVQGKRAISPETAWLLGAAFGTTPQFWMNLQQVYDLAHAKPDRKVPKIKPAH